MNSLTPCVQNCYVDQLWRIQRLNWRNVLFDLSNLIFPYHSKVYFPHQQVMLTEHNMDLGVRRYSVCDARTIGDIS